MESRYVGAVAVRPDEAKRRANLVDEAKNHRDPDHRIKVGRIIDLATEQNARAVANRVAGPSLDHTIYFALLHAGLLSEQVPTK